MLNLICRHTLWLHVSPCSLHLLLQPKVASSTLDTEETLDQLAELQVFPLDKYNLQLLDMVHPPAWINPTPRGK